MKVSVQAYRKLVANIVKPAVEFKKAEWDEDQPTQSVKYQMVKNSNNKKKRKTSGDELDPTKYTKDLYIIDGTEKPEHYLMWRMEYKTFTKLHYKKDMDRKENLISQTLAGLAKTEYEAKLREIDQDVDWGKNSMYTFNMSDEEYDEWRNGSDNTTFRQNRIDAGLNTVRVMYFGSVD